MSPICHEVAFAPDGTTLDAGQGKVVLAAAYHGGAPSVTDHST